MFTWILAQWEEYHTSLMLYGNSFYGVLECNYTLALVHVIAACVGPAFWRRPLTSLLPFLAQFEVFDSWSEPRPAQQQAGWHGR